MKQPRYKVGDIIENGKYPNSRWARRIHSVIPNYLGIEGRYGYIYEENTDAEPDNFYLRYPPSMCSEEHLYQWGRKQYKECGNCGRPATHSVGDINRCDRCNGL